MSTYEKYSKTSQHYDQTRVPVGTELIMGCLARAGRPLSELHLLDAGCGTGSYAAELVAHVAHVTAVDLNEGMLGVAKKKLEARAPADQVTLSQGSITKLPLDDEQVDAVMVNQVLHHLDSPSGGLDPTTEAGAAGSFPKHARALGELSRVLKPGGVAVINTCSETQLREGYWYFELLEGVRERLHSRYCGLDELEAKAEAVGLVRVGRFVATHAVIQGEAYFDARGPLDSAWRNGDSTWALAGEASVQKAIAKVRELDATGELERYRDDQDRRRVDVGQVTFVSFRKR